jgi:Integrase core domain
MRSGSTREFLALCAIAQHFGRPGTPTDQAWIESLNGHLKAEYPHLLAIEDPATLRAELAVTRVHYNTVRLHAGIGYVIPTTNTPASARRSARPEKPASNRPASAGLPSTVHSEKLRPARTPTMLGNQRRKCVINSDTRQARACRGQALTGQQRPRFPTPSRSGCTGVLWVSKAQVGANLLTSSSARFLWM